MLASKEILEFRRALSELERRVDQMHTEFGEYRYGQTQKMPDWDRLEKELLIFSRRKIFDLALSNERDRILFKFQNRKKIWLAWADEVHRAR
jgi:hypothetical protein